MKRAAAGLVVLLVVATTGLLALARQESFPHRRHEGLFPTCTGCHSGIPEGDAARFYPPAEACQACHDGQRIRTVELTPPSAEATNLRFSHPEHAREVEAEGERQPACVSCHQEPGAPVRMAVGRAPAEACLSCHTADSHLAPGRDCSECHTPLSRTPDLPPERIAAFPKPDGHDEPGFLLDHDPGAETTACATCHARESCTRCHLDGDALAPIRTLVPDARVAELVAGKAPTYPEPPSHETGEWSFEHGLAAEEDGAGCASCHVRSSCTGCHVGAAPEAVGAVPVAQEGDPRGVRLEAEGGVHWPGYATDHGAAAAADGACTSCHEASFCESCHAGTEPPEFHLPNFLERHGPEAYSARTDCSSCHSTEVFCRSCHTGVGLGDRRSPGVTVHTSRPFWLLGHGVAARQGLSGCVTCHNQADCATCHSAAFGWRVNPHGPSFDAERSREANPFSCARCHRDGGGP